jgi:hypothetical protein
LGTQSSRSGASIVSVIGCPIWPSRAGRSPRPHTPHRTEPAEVAETTYRPDGWEHEPLRLIVRRVAHQADALSDDPRARRRRTIPREQLALGLAGETDTVYGYSFILTDLPGRAADVERHHRERPLIEERIKDQKLGVSLSQLPLSDLDANRFWLTCTALLNLLALLNDLMFGPEPPGHLPRRRQAKSCAECCSASRPASSTTRARSSCGSPPACHRARRSHAPTTPHAASPHPRSPERTPSTKTKRPRARSPLPESARHRHPDRRRTPPRR